jgi:hypothetical protein
MRPSDRSHAIELAENIGAITAWRAGLSDKQRSRLTTAQSNLKKWRASTGRVRYHQCPKAKATAHWRRFIVALREIPPHEVEPLWRHLWDMVV